MKKILLPFIALMLIKTIAFSQKEVNGCVVTMSYPTSNNLLFKGDSVDIQFTPTQYTWGVKITNKLNSDLSIIWDKSSFILNGSASKIIFDNTLKMNIDNSIPDQIIPASSFIEKKVFPAGRFTGRWAEKTIDRKAVKTISNETGSPESAKIILSILIDGTLKQYGFEFEIKPKE